MCLVSSLIFNSFDIESIDNIARIILHIDYDDAFVAYLNNVEIARSNIGNIGDYPTFNQGSTSLHEAQMYQGGNPDQFLINTHVLKNTILPGDNILSSTTTRSLAIMACGGIGFKNITVYILFIPHTSFHSTLRLS